MFNLTNKKSIGLWIIILVSSFFIINFFVGGSDLWEGDTCINWGPPKAGINRKICTEWYYCSAKLDGDTWICVKKAVPLR